MWWAVEYSETTVDDHLGMWLTARRSTLNFQTPQTGVRGDRRVNCCRKHGTSSNRTSGSHLQIEINSSASTTREHNGLQIAANILWD
jgi:hypothetical protein